MTKLRAALASLLLAAACALPTLSLPSQALAQERPDTEIAQQAGLDGDLLDIIGRLINVFLGVLGVVFLVLFLYAGFLWMTAAGDDKKVEKAKKIFVQAIVGLIIIMSSYAIATFVFNALGRDIFGTGNNPGGNGSVSVELLSGALGGGALRDHYPQRGAMDVARNTKIMVTFKDAMDITSFVSGYDVKGTPRDITDDVKATGINTANIKIYPAAENPPAPMTQVNVSFSADLRTFVFDPVQYLGSPTADMEYKVVLDPDIRDADGDRVFTGGSNGGYQWTFTTGTQLDVTPPSIVSVTPAANGTYAPNIQVQVTFDEPMDPTSVGGLRTATGGFSNIQVVGDAGAPVSGEFKVSNGYRTVTFVTDQECGTNSCGETMYCLPNNQSHTVTVNAATVGNEPPMSESYPYDGATDVVGNSLDANNDGTAGDDYTWSFSVTGDNVTTGPRIDVVTPRIEESDIALDRPIEITFGDVLDASTVNSDAISLENTELSSGEVHEQWYRFDVDGLTATGEKVQTPGQIPTKTRVTMPHGTLLESVNGLTYVYGMTVDESLRNQYQNCYAPAYGNVAENVECAVTAEQPYCCNGSPSSSACVLF